MAIIDILKPTRYFGKWRRCSCFHRCRQSETPCCCISYVHDQIASLSAHIKQLANDGELDLLIFLPGNHTALIRALEKSLDLFNSQISSLVPREPFVDINFQLNTRTVFYDGVAGNGIQLEERYRIKRGQEIVRKVGAWNAKSGLRISTPNIWDRRSGARSNNLLYNGKLTYKPRRLPRHERAQAHNSTPNSRQHRFF
jgi:hypothetical protein